MAGQMANLMGNEKMRQEMGQRSRQESEKYDLKAVSLELDRLYESLV
jgi:hypothetical protein